MDIPQNVLVVDDDAVVLSVLEDSLREKGGFAVQALHTYHDAIGRLKTGPVEVLVVDAILDGGASGIDVCITAVELHPAVAVVLISADPACDHPGYPRRTVCLQKPFNAAALMSAIGLARKAAVAATQA